MIASESAPVLRVTNHHSTTWKGGKWVIPAGATVTVPWQWLELYGGTPGLAVDFSGAQDTLRTRDEAGRLTFDFWMPLSMIDGYGRHALSIYQAMQKVGAAPVLRDVGWGNAIEQQVPAAIKHEADNNRPRMPTKIGLTMSVPYDPRLTGHDSVYKIGITQFETDHIPAKHVAAVNRLDHLIVTSSFQPDIWRRSGVRRGLPISVLTPGVDTDFFRYVERPRGEHFRVLMLGALTGRKDPVGAVQIFQSASKGDPSWRLTIKTRPSNALEGLLQMLGCEVAYATDKNGRRIPRIPTPSTWTGRTDARIEVVVSDDSTVDVLKRYHSHDCLLWPSKGEGVGLPPLEAMATGMEVVMSDNSGMADYAFDSHCWPIPTARKEPADGPLGFSRGYVEQYGSVGQWWVPDQRKAVRQLSECHAAWKAGQGKGAKAAAYVRANHTLEIQARSVLSVVERYA